MATEQWLNNSIPINMQKLNANTAPQMAPTHEQIMPMAAAIRNADTSVGFYNGQQAHTLNQTVQDFLN
jgi:hypothetical protein